jgi:Xaa-Pro aminopeptidase
LIGKICFFLIFLSNIDGIGMTQIKSIKKFFLNKINLIVLSELEKELINYELLNKKEKNYLFKYHLNIYSEFSSLLNKKERKWLATLI